jgi:ferric iron reductase protein FhuF
MYFFRDSRSNYEGLGSVLELVASIHNSSSHELFINGCLHSISNIVKKMPVYKVLMVDEISDNSIITCKHNQINEKKIYEYWSAYYLYNMVIPWTPISGSRVFILF